MLAQLIVNILFSGSIFLTLALSFSFIYTTTRSFTLSQAAIISFSAYFVYLFFVIIQLPQIMSIFMAIICAVTISLICEIGIYRQMRRNGLSSFTLLIASIGL